jgi:hypothetical protein
MLINVDLSPKEIELIIAGLDTYIGEGYDRETNRAAELEKKFELKLFEHEKEIYETQKIFKRNFALIKKYKEKLKGQS